MWNIGRNFKRPGKYPTYFQNNRNKDKHGDIHLMNSADYLQAVLQRRNVVTIFIRGLLSQLNVKFFQNNVTFSRDDIESFRKLSTNAFNPLYHTLRRVRIQILSVGVFKALYRMFQTPWSASERTDTLFLTSSDRTTAEGIPSRTISFQMTDCKDVDWRQRTKGRWSVQSRKKSAVSAVVPVDCNVLGNGHYVIGCTFYTECINGIAYHRECTRGYVYSNVIKRCVNETTMGLPCGLKRDCTSKPDKKYSDHPISCTSYYTCQNGYYYGHNYCNPGNF
ncbi:hypothetical protein KUTeg_010096 [Tegillarca granosa]|uniref:Chitin-binding type-2 domain-containing protein n=1 Tax=Tegillarca granosa TaxID=220873 RepID=A0ABQ9F5S7_TEGGR|nr:hypothetical protein KUTeg_010096 [Tegillarca granosa]